MVNAALLVVSILMNLVSSSILRNDFCKKEVKNDGDLYAFNALTSIFSFITLAVIALISGTLSAVSAYTVVLGLVFGIITALTAIFLMKALGCGPMSYTSVITSCSLVIPAFSGMLIFRTETVTPIQYVGVVCMIVSFICAMDKKNDKAGISLKWFLFCMAAFIFNGSIGVMQKIHQNSSHKGELSAFLLTAFLVSTAFSVIMIPVVKGKNKSPDSALTVFRKEKVGKYLIFGVICGVFTGFCNHINMYLSGEMPSVIFFPVVNGAYMILTAIVGVLFLKERFSVKQWIGLVVGTAAIFLLCMA